MTYCKLGEKATVNYSFKGVEKTFTTKGAIEVQTYTKRINAGVGFSTLGFAVSFYSPNNRNNPEFIVYDYFLFPVPNGEQFYPGQNYVGFCPWFCGEFDFRKNPDGSPNGPGANSATVTINPSKKCPMPLTANRCSIEVKHNGIIIFQDQGECPVNFEVVCGENCPPDTVKCRKSGYPGYCCLPCQPTKQSIISIRNIVKNINQGPVSRG